MRTINFTPTPNLPIPPHYTQRPLPIKDRTRIILEYPSIRIRAVVQPDTLFNACAIRISPDGASHSYWIKYTETDLVTNQIKNRSGQWRLIPGRGLTMSADPRHVREVMATGADIP
jgi:hypothetical protein